jgi:hypothetical protein
MARFNNLWLFGWLAEGVDFFGQIDAYRTPGDAPPATDTSRHAELVNPGGYFVRQPHPIPVFGGGTKIFPVDVSVI